MIGPDVHWWTCKAEKEGLQSVCNITRSRKDDMSPCHQDTAFVFGCLESHIQATGLVPRTGFHVTKNQFSCLNITSKTMTP